MRAVVLLALVTMLAGCATAYQRSGFSGGFSERHLEGDIWRVSFGGNGYTTRETVQTYWLYRCAQVALDHGYDGFQILSQIRLIDLEQLKGSVGDRSPYIKTSGTVYIPMYIPYSYNKPRLTADIRLLRGPIQERPPVVFDARKLKAALDPIVNAEKKCDRGNVCPHVHRYLYPKGTLENPPSAPADTTKL